MTREEAIKHLETYSTTNGSGQTSQAQHEEAKRIAIEALEQEPIYFPPCVDCNTKMNEIREAHDRLKNQEPCEDIVSRKAVVELIEGWWLGHTKEDDLATEVKALPAVTPILKSGTTNGDVIEATGLFDIIGNLSNDMFICVGSNGFTSRAFMSFSRAWWNAPYKRTEG